MTYIKNYLCCTWQIDKHVPVCHEDSKELRVDGLDLINKILSLIYKQNISNRSYSWNAPKSTVKVGFANSWYLLENAIDVL